MKRKGSNARPVSPPWELYGKLAQIAGILLMAAGAILLASLVSHAPGSAFNPNINTTQPPKNPRN